jgi:hypothetical protein
MVGKYVEIQVRFEVFTLITKNSSVVWNMMPFTSVYSRVGTQVPTYALSHPTR